MKPGVSAVFAAILAGGCNGDDDGGAVDSALPTPTVETVVINEYMASNATTLVDNAGAYPDWVELYNGTGGEVDLSGWYLTDDLTEPTKWQFPAGITISNGGFLVLFTDNDPEEGELHVEWQMAKEGGDLGLYGPDADGQPQLDAIQAYGPQSTDVSMARQPDGWGDWQSDDTPTPGASNN